MMEGQAGTRSRDVPSAKPGGGVGMRPAAEGPGPPRCSSHCPGDPQCSFSRSDAQSAAPSQSRWTQPLCPCSGERHPHLRPSCGAWTETGPGKALTIACPLLLPSVNLLGILPPALPEQDPDSSRLLGTRPSKMPTSGTAPWSGRVFRGLFLQSVKEAQGKPCQELCADGAGWGAGWPCSMLAFKLGGQRFSSGPLVLKEMLQARLCLTSSTCSDVMAFLVMCESLHLFLGVPEHWSACRGAPFCRELVTRMWVFCISRNR